VVSSLSSLLLWVNASRENGRQQNKSVRTPLLANRENERPHEAKTATDMYAYRETAVAISHGKSGLTVNESNGDISPTTPGSTANFPPCIDLPILPT
jgi:hypothetical protein